MQIEDAEIEARCPRWIMAPAALQLLAPHYGKIWDAQNRLISWAGAGLVATRCRRMVTSGNRPTHADDCLVSSKFWAQFESIHSRRGEDWVAGDFVVSDWARHDETRKVQLYSVSFCETDLVALLPETRPNSPRPSPATFDPSAELSAPAAAPRSKGGRRAGKHGQPIARVTRRLLALPPAQLASYTVAAVAAELAEEYRKLGHQPPHPDNAEKDAAGILRAVKE